jgi:predicted RNase H-like nuclease (RuvC/YqgF family)
MEVDFDKLYNMYVKAKKDVQKYKMQLSHNIYHEEDHKYYIKKYLHILDRNIQEMTALLHEKYEQHEDMVHQANQELDFNYMSDEKKFQCLWILYDKATNKDNADRDHYKTAVKDDMHGRMLN